MNQLESVLNEWFGAKAPQLPESWKKFIVTVSPWLAIIGVVLGAIGVFTLFSATSSMMAIGGAYAYAALGYSSPMFWVGMVLMAVIVVFEALAIPGLRKRTYDGWRWIYYASLVSLVQGLITMNFVSAIIGAIISFYILFQVRSHYAGAPDLGQHPQQ